MLCECSSCLNVVVNIATIISLVFAVFSFKKDHDRSRREASIDLIIKWSNSLNKKTALAKKYVEQMNDKQIQHLFNQEKVYFNKRDQDEVDLYNNIVNLLNEDKMLRKKSQHINRKLGKIKSSTMINSNNKCAELALSEEESAELRWIIVSYLNMLESILAAWQHRAADDYIIEQEFKYMFDLSSGKNILQSFRIASGSEKCYPAIEMFYNHLEKKRKKSLKRKRKI